MCGLAGRRLASSTPAYSRSQTTIVQLVGVAFLESPAARVSALVTTSAASIGLPPSPTTCPVTTARRGVEAESCALSAQAEPTKSATRPLPWRHRNRPPEVSRHVHPHLSYALGVVAHVHLPRLTAHLAILDIGLVGAAARVKPDCYRLPAIGTGDVGLGVPCSVILGQIGHRAIPQRGPGRPHRSPSGGTSGWRQEPTVARSVVNVGRT